MYMIAPGNNPSVPNPNASGADFSPYREEGFTFFPGNRIYMIEDPTGVRSIPFDKEGRNATNQPYAKNLANALDHMDRNRLDTINLRANQRPLVGISNADLDY